KPHARNLGHVGNVGRGERGDRGGHGLFRLRGKGSAPYHLSPLAGRGRLRAKRESRVRGDSPLAGARGESPSSGSQDARQLLRAGGEQQKNAVLLLRRGGLGLGGLCGLWLGIRFGRRLFG